MVVSTLIVGAALFLSALGTFAQASSGRWSLFVAGFMAWSLGVLLWMYKARHGMRGLARDVRSELDRLLTDADGVGVLVEPRAIDSGTWFQLWYPDAEPPERRFNVASFVAAQIAALVGGVAWLVTLSACSNTQFKDPRFSCPSGARIGTVWILLAAAVGSLFLSRILIARRLRRWYRPLLILNVLCGVALLMLLIFRPSWGVKA
jgi:hypothetical protein